MGAGDALPDGVVVGQVLLPQRRLRPQRKVNLQEAVLHPLGGKLALRPGQHGRQGHALRHGLLVVAMTTEKQKTEAQHFILYFKKSK